MPTITDRSAAADLEPLVLPLKGGDGVLRDYAIPPVTAEQLWDVKALDVAYTAIYMQRTLDMSGGSAEHIIEAMRVTDEHLADALRRIMNGKMTARDAIYLPLGPEVGRQMELDGCLAEEVKIAAVAATVWHFGGDMATVRSVWTTGKVSPGNPAARPWMNSPRTGAGLATGRAPTPRTTTPPSPTTSDAA